MEYVTKEEAIGMVHRVMGEYLLGQRVFYTDKDDILFDIDKSICAEIGKLPKCSILEGEFTVIPITEKAVMEERVKWLSVINDIKSATNDIEWFGDDAFWDGVSAVIDIINRKVEEKKHDKRREV